MFIIFILSLLLLICGITEQLQHNRRIQRIPIRIHVNGTRGKSTTTRLIAAGLREGGFKVLAKTTGTLPRLILEDGTELPVKRRGNANISEQMKIISNGAKRRVDALVLECMAVNPEPQWVSEHKMIKSTIGVITNVREDHLEDIGAGPDNTANILKLTIPKNGTLITTEKKYQSIFKEQAGKLNTKIIWANPDDISDKVINQFNYMNFKENISIALQVNKLLGINEEIALKGMLKTNPDPGALKVYKLSKSNKDLIFVNAFAANDRNSTLLIWEKLKEKFDLHNLPVMGIINSREDRALRSIQFAHILAHEIKPAKIILVGPLSKLTERTLLKLEVNPNKIINFKKFKRPEKVVDTVLKLFNKSGMLIGFGNTKGTGQNLIDYFEKFGEVI